MRAVWSPGWGVAIFYRVVRELSDKVMFDIGAETQGERERIIKYL